MDKNTGINALESEDTVNMLGILIKSCLVADAFMVCGPVELQ